MTVQKNNPPGHHPMHGGHHALNDNLEPIRANRCIRTSHGPGRTACYCGEVSGVLPNSEERRLWMKNHRATVWATQYADTWTREATR